jgi:hypothetical protein
VRPQNGRGPPSIGARNDPQIEQPAKTLADKNKPKAQLSQGAATGLPCEPNEVFVWHFTRYVADAGRQSLLDAAETEPNPRELLRFAEARFHSLIYGFEASFFDSWEAIGVPFRDAARNSIQTGRRA